MKGKFVWPHAATIISVAMLAGIIAGIGTFFLRKGMAWILTMSENVLVADRLNWWFLLLLFISIFGAVFYQKMVGEDLSDSTGQIRMRLQRGDFTFRGNHLFSPLVGCLITMGFGASAGAEGPCAFSGAAIGSRLAKAFKMSPKDIYILFGCGAAAGIAGIFKSPIGGLFFAIEVLRMEMTVIGIVSATIACLGAFSSAYVLEGYTWNIMVPVDMQFIPEHFGWIALLGAVCGIYSIYYCKTNEIAGNFFKGIRNVWIRAGICALGLGVMIMLLPAMFGEGYDIVTDMVNGIDDTLVKYGPFYSADIRENILIMAVVIMLLLKGAAVGAVNNGGGVAGEFVPTIFAGALLGYLFATVANHCGLNLPVENFVLTGTAAVMAGTIKAPLMSIFIAAEVSDRYGFLLGFVLAASLSYIISKFHSVYVVRPNSQKRR